MIHGKVYSDVLKQIIILAASEFEIIAKALCAKMGECAKDIKDISKVMLKHFPNLHKTEITTPFCVAMPLQDWSVVDNRVVGLEWWKAYNTLKHNEIDSYKNATLENAFLSVL